MIKISMIVAAADNNIIGKNNQMPWHITEDFQYFKKKTLGKPCIMGRKTFESIYNSLGKALPNRPSIAVSRNGYEHEQAISASNIPYAIEKAKELAEQSKVDEIMIIGGATIYEQSLSETNRIYLTRVHQSPDGDAFFPELNKSEWKEISCDKREGFSFLIYERV